ncbi:MAG: GNAT family N-acetyltransferase [Bacteroidales bacterium]|nr:GNAT family N-acetyltransferase [Bacteroidales bacterium]
MDILYEDNLSDKKRWLSVWSEWKGKEIYAHPDYLRLYVKHGIRACCALFEMDKSTIIYPFMLRDMSKEPYFSSFLDPAVDIISPYGYGGVCCWGEGDRNVLLAEFNRRFAIWCKEQHIVSEFVRFYIEYPCLHFFPGEVEHNNDDVVVDLMKDISVMWSSFKPKVRKNVNRAIKCGVQVELDPNGERLDDFLEIYYETMDRCNAESGYYFPREYFLSLNEHLKGQYMYFHAVHEGRVVATELVLVSDYNIYSFLGGTRSTSFDLRPNDILKFKIIEWGMNVGKKAFVLGGGYIPHDGIFNYKLSFAPDGIKPFYIGKRICDAHAYEKLVEIHKSQNESFNPETSFFPLYRS